MKNGGVEGGSRVKESHKEAGEEPATGKRSRATHKFPLHANCIFNIYINYRWMGNLQFHIRTWFQPVQLFQLMLTGNRFHCKASCIPDCA